MLKTALKGLLGHKLRLAITAVAIALGVGFMAGTLVLTDTLARTFDDLFARVGAGVDAEVRARSVVEGSTETGQQRADVDPAIVERITAVEGVKGAEANVLGFAVPVKKDGTPIASASAPQFGGNWYRLDEVNPYELVEGQPPRGPKEAVIDRSLAKSGDFSVGDPIKVQTIGPTLELEVVGIATFGGSDNAAGATFVAMDTPNATRYFSADGRVQTISVVGEEGVSQEELVRRIGAILPGDLEAVTGAASIDEAQQESREQLEVFNAFFSGFAAVSLVVGAFLIYNTFGIIIGQRTRELALLRSLGAGRGQVLGSVLLEAAVIGLLASLAGIVLGVGLAVGLKALLDLIGIDLPDTAPVIAPRTVIVSIVLGVVITTLSALVPAVKASRVPPLAAIRDVAVERVQGSAVRAALGVVLGALGIAGLVAGAANDELAQVLTGVVLVFAAVVVLGPRIAPVVARGLGAPLPRLAGIPGLLARENATRNPKRSAGTASALMLSVAVVTVLSIFFFSFLASINSSVDQDLLADYQIDTGGFGFPTLSPEIATRLEERPEVAAASGVRFGSFAVEGDSHPVYGVDGADVDELFDLGLEEGSFEDLGADGFAVDRVTAEEQGWRLGTELDVTFPNGTTRPMRIVAVYDNAGIVAQNSDGHYLLDNSVFTAEFPAQNQFDARVAVRSAEGVSSDEARAAIDEVAAAFPSAEVRDRDGIKEEQNSQLYQSLGILVVMLALSVLIGGLGITNTLALSVFERTREVGLLRAVGASRRQLRASIGYESVILTLFGTIMGMVIGVAGGAALISALSGTLIRATISVPIPFLVAVLLLAVIIGVLASLLPAWRASRLDVLRAVAAE